MKEMNKKNYLSPMVEIMNARVEKGFQMSGNTDPEINTSKVNSKEFRILCKKTPRTGIQQDSPVVSGDQDAEPPFGGQRFRRNIIDQDCHFYVPQHVSLHPFNSFSPG